MPDDQTPDGGPREGTHEQDAEPVEPVVLPPSDEVAAAILERFEGARFVESHSQAVVYLDRSQWRDAAEFLRNEQQFAMCVDITAVDFLTAVTRAVPDGVEPERFEVVANFLSHARNRRVRLVAQVPATDAEIASLTPVYAGLNFPEREVFDLFGITFVDHPDLTRILMPDDWEGHPLRKDDAPARVPVTFKEDPRPS
jgi:NADH-quinone oxidoreductase subunit C